MKLKKIKAFPFFRFYELIGVETIAEFADCNTADIIDWIVHYDFPAVRTTGNVWIAKKRSVKKFLKKVNPERTKLPEVRYFQKPKKIRRW